MDADQKFEILKTELSLIQATLDKYDDLIFRGRNLFVTLWIASLGLAFTIKSPAVPLLAALLSILYWFLEGMMRHQYWFKYVDRYRFLRSQLNSPEFKLSAVSVYDLTNHFHRAEQSRWARVKACFFKLEPSISFGVMGAAAILIWLLIHAGVLTFPVGPNNSFKPTPLRGAA
ncbi:hypothetical protein [Thauera sp. SDU_THAU2]|uniref:hypothetical protein n=1 Tax=Thauera sp. SDU_THAU2 TaxID=3136633 RepID=UPI00311F3497